MAKLSLSRHQPIFQSCIYKNTDVYGSFFSESPHKIRITFSSYISNSNPIQKGVKVKGYTSKQSTIDNTTFL